MSSPEIASATKPSLAQDWLNALRYWLRGRKGVIALIVLGGRDRSRAQLELAGGGRHRAASSGRAAVRRDVRSRPVHEQDERRFVLDVRRAPPIVGTPTPDVVAACRVRAAEGAPVSPCPKPARCRTIRPSATSNGRRTNNRKSRRKGSDMRKHLKTLLVASTIGGRPGRSAGPLRPRLRWRATAR